MRAAATALSWFVVVASKEMRRSLASWWVARWRHWRGSKQPQSQRHSGLWLIACRRSGLSLNPAWVHGTFGAASTSKPRWSTTSMRLFGRREDPPTIELITIAACTGSRSMHRSLTCYHKNHPRSCEEDIEVAVNDTYKLLGRVVCGIEAYHSQSILRNGLRSSFATSPRHMMHFCVGVNLGPLKQKWLYCYLDLKFAFEKKLRVLFSKTAQVVLVGDRVPREALCVCCRHPRALNSVFLSSVTLSNCKRQTLVNTLKNK